MANRSAAASRHLHHKLAQARRLLGESRTQLHQARLHTTRLQQAAATQAAALLHTLDNAIIVAGSDLRVSLVSPAYCHLFGLPQPYVHYLGAPVGEVLEQFTIGFQHPDEAVKLHRHALEQQVPLQDALLSLANGRILKLNYLPVAEQGVVALHLWSYQDVTQQQHLQAHISQLSRLAEFSPHPIICYTPAGHPQYFNPAAGPVLEELTAQASQEGNQFLRHELAAALAAGQTRFRQFALNDHVYYWTVVPLLTEDCVNVYLTDFTDQQRLSTELASSQRLLERVLETAPNVIYTFDLLEERVTYCNRHMYDLLGYTEQELMAMGVEEWQQLLAAEDRTPMRDYWHAMRAAADGEIRTIEYHVYHRNGTRLCLRTSTTPLERDASGQARLAAGALEDITKWKQAEAQRRAINRGLAEKNRLFQQIIDTSPQLIFIRDAQGHFQLANQAAADFYGVSKKQLLRGNYADVMPDEDVRTRLLEQDQQVIRARIELFTEEHFEWHDGRERWFQCLKQPFVLADGTVQVLAVASEITAQKQVNAELRQAKETAEQTARVKQEFLANISHEIRTPMHGILGMASLLGRTPLTDEQREFVQHIQESAENLLVVINDVLDVSQLLTGKIKLEERVFDVRDVLRRSVEAVRFRVEEKGISLHLELPAPDVPTQVLGDPYRLTQILLNLLSNAVKFTNQGHVTLRCEPLPHQAKMCCFAFVVEDTGIGIAASQLEEMFEPFTQASASTARRYGGTGLGLSISKGLVERLGGTITAHSQVQQGSTFRVELPLRPVIGPATATPTAVEQPPLGPHRLLLVEDNAVSLFLTKKLLANWGLVVDAAPSGAEALELFRAHSYALVLMDIQMPEMDGITTTHHLRQHPDAQRAATPVVALTANALPDQTQLYRAAGFQAFLSKPFSDQQLYVLLQHHLPAKAHITEQLFDLKNIQLVAQGDEAFIRHMMQLFIDTAPPALAKLEGFYAQQQWQRVAEMAHHLKSSFYSLNVRSLLEPIRELEAAASQPHVDAGHVATLIRYIRQVAETVIEQLRPQIGA
ncbi:PAS domain S-box protein [Hymenobacter guriensis]|uniref:histidine kinase n=1 Tax=Hymenobacter guriensis TaxID=2793065 RepID=A0ABS0L2N0_9BACT|nr:PAS domain S-box protein [Hymenobacter guriensis]MBG8554328.1 PAS domain S-box protein [Hymenobacter guriensis]